MKTQNRTFSRLTAEEKRDWDFKARQIIYPGLEPVTEEKELRVKALAADLYYKSIGKDDVSGYDYEVRCDCCDVLLGYWRYAGPFHGSMRCADCRDKEDSQ